MEIEKLHKDITHGDIKLTNANYVERAPTDIIEREHQRINDMCSALEKLVEQSRKIVSCYEQQYQELCQLER